MEHIHESINSQKNILITKLVLLRNWCIYHMYSIFIF